MTTALIVSHGQPSDPDPAEADLAALAAAVETHLPGWRVLSATLAKPGGLEALAAKSGLCYPMFMAGGWFTQTHLPQRLVEAGGDWRILPPFGLDPAVQDLGLQMVAEAGGGEVLLAAHGSFRSDAPSAVARVMAQRLAVGGKRAEAYFIDQEPRIATARGFGAGSVCLPFFAARGGHVIDDLPAALAEAGFGGRVLMTLGCDARVPGLIAAALRGAAHHT